MARPKAAITGIITLIFVGGVGGWVFLRSSEETKERNSTELTGEMEPQVLLVQVLEDAEVPDGLSPLEVGDSDIYLIVTVFYPGLPHIPDANEHRLTNINGDPSATANPLAMESDADDRGARIDLFFRVAGEFETARLVRGDAVVAARLTLDEE